LGCGADRYAPRVVLAAVLGVLAICCGARPAAAQGEATLAVLAGGPELEDLAVLVQAELSGQDVDLVERAELDAIAQELELAAADMAGGLARIGALVRADAFLLLSLGGGPDAEAGSKGESLLRVRVAETVHGVRLLDTLLPWRPEDLEATAGLVREAAAPSAAKLTQHLGELLPVGIVDIHRVQLDEEHQWICRTLRAMLAARLSAQPRIVVLEREDLALLGQEALLTRGEDSAFEAAAVLIDGYVQRDRDAMRLQLQVRPPEGEARNVAARFGADELARAADRAARDILQSLADPGEVRPWDPAAEAVEFHDQGIMLRNHRRFAAAQPMLETACALAPDRLDYAGDLVSFAYYSQYMRPPLYSDLELAELAGRVMGRLAEAERGDEDAVRAGQAVFQYLVSVPANAEERVVEVNRRTRMQMDAFWRSRGQAFDSGRPDLLGRLEISLGLTRASTPEEALANVRAAFDKSIAALGGEDDEAAERVYWAFWGFADQYCISVPHPGPRTSAALQKTFYDGLLAYFEEMAANHPEPIVRFGSHLIVAQLVPALLERPDRDPGIDPWPHALAGADIFAAHLQDDPGFRTEARASMRSLLLKSLGRASRPALREVLLSRVEAFWLPPLEAGDLDAFLEWRPGQNGLRHVVSHMRNADSPILAARYTDMLNDALALCEPRRDEKAVAEAAIRIQRDIDATEDEVRTAHLFYKTRVTHGINAEESRRRLAIIERAWPDIMLAAELPGGISVRMLLRHTDWPLGWYFRHQSDIYSHVALREGEVWVAFADESKPMRVGLACIEMPSGHLAAAWQGVAPESVRRDYLRFRGLAVGRDHSYLTIQKVGLVQLPGYTQRGSGLLRDLRIITTADGLPTNIISAVADYDGKLLLGYGTHDAECGLGIFDPRSGEWSTVFSSAIRGETVLERGRSYQVDDLIRRPEGYYFWVNMSDGRQPSGLWRLVPEAQTLEFLVKLRGFLPRLVDLGDRLMVTDIDDMTVFDTANRAALRLLSGTDKAGDELWPLKDAPFFAPSASGFGVFGHYEHGHLSAATGTVHGGAFWARSGLHRIAVVEEGQAPEDGLVVDNNLLDGGPVLRFQSTPWGLLAIGVGSVGLIERAPAR
jgi:hypothetical protein